MTQKSEDVATLLMDMKLEKSRRVEVAMGENLSGKFAELTYVN